MFSGKEEFTEEQYLKVASLAKLNGGKAPICVLLATELGNVTQEDIEWAKSLAVKINKK